MSSADLIRPLLLKVPEACAVLRAGRSQLYLLLKSGDTGPA